MNEIKLTGNEGPFAFLFQGRSHNYTGAARHIYHSRSLEATDLLRSSVVDFLTDEKRRRLQPPPYREREKRPFCSKKH